MRKNLKKLAVIFAAGLMISACSNQASSDQTSEEQTTQAESTEAEVQEEVLSAQFELREDGIVVIEKDSPIPFGKSREDVETIIGTAGKEDDPYQDEHGTNYEEFDYDMIWFDYENPIVTCFTFMEDSLVKLNLEMDQHVTKELAREIMTSYYGEADNTEISDYGAVCIWEDQENDRRFVLIPDEYDRYTIELTSLSDQMSSSVSTDISVFAPEGNEDGNMTGEFGSFESFDLDMNPVNQSILKDHKLTMINVWGTFCGPCLSEMPALGELNTEYADKGFQIIGIVTDVVNQDGTVSDSQIAVAKEYAEKTGANYIHLLPTIDLYEIVLKDMVGVPTTVFVDENGTILKEVSGAKSKEKWQADIDELLGE